MKTNKRNAKVKKATVDVTPVMLISMVNGKLHLDYGSCFPSNLKHLADDLVEQLADDFDCPIAGYQTISWDDM